MRVLVTGSSGFLGSQLVAMLKMQEEVEVIDTNGVDLRLLDETSNLFERTKPDLAYHLAASVGGIEANRKHPAKFFFDNMVMGMNVMQMARWHDVRKLVMVGTCCSYPRETPLPMRETDLWLGYPEETNAPYGIAKRSLITMLQAYRQEYNVNYVSAILANLYGPGDHFDLEFSHVIPGMIRRFIEARNQDVEVTLWGTGLPTREFLYVGDAAHALIKVMSRYDEGEPINIGTGIETKLIQLAEMIAAIVGYKKTIHWDSKRPNGQLRRVLDISKQATIGFEPKMPLEEGLRQTVEWFEDHQYDGWPNQ